MAESKESGIYKALRQNRSVQVNPKEEVKEEKEESNETDHLRIELRLDQIKKLDDLVKEIKLNRFNKKRERITKSTLIRVLIDNINFDNINFDNIYNENELKKRIYIVKGIKQKI